MSNYFQLFDLPVCFTLDDAELKSRYLAQLQLTHPDRFANASNVEKAVANQRGALLNAAYHHLKDPLRRIIYLQSLVASAGDIEQTTHTDTDFLQHQMQLREMLDEADDNQRKALHSSISDDLANCLTQFDAAYRTQDFVQSQIILERALFFNKCLQQC